MKDLHEAVFKAVTEIDLDGCSDEDILRLSISAEQSAINLYNRLSRAAKDPVVKKLLEHTAFEEKVHVGEFQAVLFGTDGEEGYAHEEGYEEVEEIIAEIDFPIDERIIKAGTKLKVYSKKK